MKKEIGVIGLGKMGGNIVRHLIEKGWTVHGYDPAESVMHALCDEGMREAMTPSLLISQLESPRLVWLMVPAGKIVDELLFGKEGLPAGRQGIAKQLSKGDVVIDGGNSFYEDSVTRAKKVQKLGLKYIDVGFSGGPSGARHGGCLMIGGDEKTFRTYEPLFRDLSVKDGYQFFKGAGAGHFVKMVHNGIEYGMMQALAEGFALLRRSKFKLDLTRVADIYNHKSVIESRLVGWMQGAFEEYGEDLKGISGSVGHTGEGEWTVKTAKKLGTPAKVIEEAFKFRVASKNKPSYTGKLVSALRNQFGGHSVSKNK